jgi:hypothetical protein
LLTDFKTALRNAGFSQVERKHAKAWLFDGVTPSPKRNYPIRLCFAFGLNGQAALDFLWKVCRVNGFNFRRAEDIVYCYCLENGKTYVEAKTLIEHYQMYTADKIHEESDATERTHTLRSVFGKLTDMSEDVFFKKLCENKKNFIQYSKTAHEECTKLCEKLKVFFRKDVNEYNRYRKFAILDTYDFDISIYPEIVYSFDRINAASKLIKGKATTLGNIADCFPQSKYLVDIFSTPSAATDKEHDRARKIFVLLYFADYALAWSSYLERSNRKNRLAESCFSDFCIALNSALDKCGYAKLYPAYPFDWLILNCVRSLDVADDEKDDMNPVELFNETLMMLADENDERSIPNE